MLFRLLFGMILFTLMGACSSGDGKHARQAGEKVNNTSAIKTQAKEFVAGKKLECEGDCPSQVAMAMVKKGSSFEQCLVYALNKKNYIMSTSCANSELRSTLGDCHKNLFVLGQDQKLYTCESIQSYRFSDTSVNYPQIFSEDYLIFSVREQKEDEHFPSQSFESFKGDEFSILVHGLKETDNSFKIVSKECSLVPNNYLNPLFKDKTHPVMNIVNCDYALNKGDLIFNKDKTLQGYIVEESECSRDKKKKVKWCNKTSFDKKIPLHYYAFNLNCLDKEKFGFTKDSGCSDDVIATDLAIERELQTELVLDTIYRDISKDVKDNPLVNLCVSYSKGASFDPVNLPELCTDEAPELGELRPQPSVLRWPIRYRVACIKRNMRWLNRQPKEVRYSFDIPLGHIQLKLDPFMRLKDKVRSHFGRVQISFSKKSLLRKGETELTIKVEGEKEKVFQGVEFCP